MGIDRHIIGLYGIGGMVGVGGEGYGDIGVWYGLVSGVQGISNPDCNTLLRQNPARLNPEEPCPMTVPTLNPGVCTAVIARISYASLSVITRLTVLTL